MSDQTLMNDVGDELFWDPKVDNVAIAVSADDGDVTLRGTVGSFREKQEARKDAERVYGVKSVKNELEVRLLDEHRREDADLRGDVLKAFALDFLIPSTVDAKVRAGNVTLKGTVDWQYEREEAEFVAANVLGVIDVVDEIKLKGSPKAKAVKEDIKGALERNAALDADNLSVTTSNGTVKIKGVVNSWSEHDEAVSAAWAAPGVTDVDDRILVEY
ncbi:MAG TPA: BON domain-containing protein [Solirubrobacteraceae bacterium]|nr:BON domain-containing protein [Solirubrobacteraceae bacterium]